MPKYFSLLAVLLLIPAPSPAAKSRVVNRRVVKKAKKPPVAFVPEMVNDPKTTGEIGPHAAGSAVLRAQILLDRAYFSVGEIDGAFGENMRATVTAFETSHGLPADSVIRAAMWKALNTDTAPALVPYTIATVDVTGPFEKLPQDMEEKAKLKALNYESPLDGLAEKFHVSPKLLTKLNPGKDFSKAGEEILAPNVGTPAPAEKAASVVVHKSNHSVEALDVSGKVLAHYTASIGSEHDPLPIGTWKITGKRINPEFHYNPALFWDAKSGDTKATLPPGPRGPVGSVWISLSKEHYGIHGTPVPSSIGKTQSHGCIRLTNWDALELAAMVTAGTPAILQEE